MLSLLILLINRIQCPGILGLCSLQCAQQDAGECNEAQCRLGLHLHTQPILLHGNVHQRFLVWSITCVQGNHQRGRRVMPTPMTSPRPRRSRLDPIPPNEPLDHETRHTWNPRSARDTCVPHEDSPFWTPRPKNVPKDDAHRHTPRTCIEARNVYLNSLYFLSLISPIFHVQHSFPCI